MRGVIDGGKWYEDLEAFDVTCDMGKYGKIYDN
jgi:hypothetical protein